MSGVNIDYTIEDISKITPTEGKISDIMQKKSDGFRIEETDTFQFNIKLKTKAIVKVIQFKAIVGDRIFVQLMGERKVVHQSIPHPIQEHKPDLIVCKQSSARKQVTTRIRVEINNFKQKILGVGLIYFLVKGQKVPEQKQKTNSKAPDNFFKQPEFSAHKIPVSDRKKDIFNDRQRKRKVSEDIKQLDKSYEEQIRKAKEESKKEMMKTQHKKQETMSLYVQPRDYTKVDFEKYRSIFQNVNANWLNAQKKQEAKRGIKQSERLSSAIQVRHFHNKKILVDIHPPTKKQEMEKLCDRMGAKVLKQLCDYCILITNRVDTQKVAKAKKLKHVKILKPNFIEDCKQCEAYLDEKDYFHKL